MQSPVSEPAQANEHSDSSSLWADLRLEWRRNIAGLLVRFCPDLFGCCTCQLRSGIGKLVRTLVLVCCSFGKGPNVVVFSPSQGILRWLQPLVGACFGAAGMAVHEVNLCDLGPNYGCSWGAVAAEIQCEDGPDLVLDVYALLPPLIREVQLVGWATMPSHCCF